MTEIERKALVLLNDVFRERGQGKWVECSRKGESLTEAICRAIEQHEAFKREVSDAVADAMDDWPVALPLQLFIALENMKRFIITKPDPLVEVMNEWWDADGYADIETFRAAIEKRGGKIVWGEG